MKRLLFVSLFVFFGACSGETVGQNGTHVGGPCSDAGDCDYLCEQSGDFPSGMCTASCDSNEDCPSGTACISNKSGICLPTCTSADDCREGYKCAEESLEESDKDDPGKVMVCSKGS